jgi:hypothetical protein
LCCVPARVKSNEDATVSRACLTLGTTALPSTNLD